MKIAIGSDKSGFSAKEAIKAYLAEAGVEKIGHLAEALRLRPAGAEDVGNAELLQRSRDLLIGKLPAVERLELLEDAAAEQGGTEGQKEGQNFDFFQQYHNSLLSVGSRLIRCRSGPSAGPRNPSCSQCCGSGRGGWCRRPRL